MKDRLDCKLGDIIKLVTKGTTPSTLGGGFKTSGINFIKSEAVSYDGRIDKSTFVYIDDITHEKLKRSQLQENDILFSMAGVFLGKTGLVTKDMLPANTNQALAIIRVDEKKTTPLFVHYYLRQSSVIDYVNTISGQSAQPNINFEEIKSIEVSLPEIQEQQSIAEVLSSLDDKIDLLHRQNKTLEQMAETLFRQWFVEEAKDDWEICILSDIAQFFNGKSRPKDEGDIPVYGGNGVLGYTNKYNYEGRSIIVGRVGAYCGSLYMEEKPIWVSDNAILIKAIKGYEFFYLFYLLRTLNLNSMAEGSSHPLLTQGLLKSIEFNKPNENKIRDFETVVSALVKKVDYNKNHIRNLEIMRDILLPKLMNGTIRVNND